MSVAESESTILIVDDTSNNIQLVGSLLRDRGYQIMVAMNGRQALDSASEAPPDLILLDIRMPEMDGFEVCRELKANPETADIPIVFLTADTEADDIVKGFEMGAVDYITKPFNGTELLTRVRTHLELKHSRDDLLRVTGELRQINDEKNEIMNIVAHDLRTPLWTSINFAEMILENPLMDHSKLEKIASDIQLGSKAMMGMVEKLLDAQTIENGEIPVSKSACDLSAIAEEVVMRYAAHATAKQQTIRFESAPSPALGDVDPQLTTSILNNLVSNAIKFTPYGKEIQLSVAIDVNKIRIRIADEGPGISAVDRARLFQKFTRLSARPTAGESSLGLGLYTVDKLTRLIGGRVYFDDTADRGAVFILALPRSQP